MGHSKDLEKSFIDRGPYQSYIRSAVAGSTVFTSSRCATNETLSWSSGGYVDPCIEKSDEHFSRHVDDSEPYSINSGPAIQAFGNEIVQIATDGHMDLYLVRVQHRTSITPSALRI